MVKMNTFERWFSVGCAVALLMAFFWIACTQRTPLDPTRSLQDEVFLLVNISASPSQVATGGAQSEIRAQLVDEEGAPLANRVVTFSTNLGTVTSQDTTDADGWVQAVLTSGSDPGEASVTVRYGQLTSVTVSVAIVSPFEAQMQISAEPASILANGLDATTITVTLVADSALPVVGEAVAFTASQGAITSSVLTDGDGKARATLTSLASAEDVAATVTATYDSLTVSLVVFFRGIQFTVEANPSSILADGQSTSSVVAVLKETANHVAIPNANIIFSTDAGLIPSQKSTDVQGVAQVALTSAATPNTAHVVAYYGGLLSDTVEVDFYPLAESEYLFSDLSLSDPKILASGVDESTVTVRVIDGDQNPVADDSVRFSSTAGTIAPEWVKTNANFGGKLALWVTGDAKEKTVARNVLNTEGMWQEVTAEGITPAGDNVGVYLNLMDGTGTAWFDDVELVAE